MINKQVTSLVESVSDIFDGATVMIGGFGEAGSPIELIHALIDNGAKNLTVVSNNTGSGHVGLAALIENKQVKKMICSFPRTANSMVFPELYRDGKIELELVPQGTLAERIRAGGAGIPAFFTPTSVNTPLAVGKESRIINGVENVLEYAIKADYSLVKCHKADRYGNLIYHATARNFGPIMCSAANITIVQSKQIVEAGKLNPEEIITPGIFVERVIEITNPAHESELVENQMRYPC
ncbi:MAG: 3-oxoacid CoA-transferase subunit A [Flavobacteriales bacterium]|jgi:3-oxoadipate CoA-transferase, alpha subunit|nr:3-oxoacid CoA-transferase subunit A [Flavobacteriales bacterium]MBT6699760.1 3-oxoacid CoA-transferase subunit A [Flavobacteriales bacterium]MBT6815207.1 3-oxoacid CoA-transferase subunit A [Flavobacteriales bacterium]MBT7620153.1 3-oxoacid CoA-transferase subunit A [Flavobacteriales bacterium]MBT7727055.1 3-oxoacid CoA-transferase subunit A [Flavobacteriales bacterium]